GLALPRTPMRRPVKRIVAEYSSPSVPESNQCVTTNASGSTALASVARLTVDRSLARVRCAPDPASSAVTTVDRALEPLCGRAALRRDTSSVRVSPPALGRPRRRAGVNAARGWLRGTAGDTQLLQAYRRIDQLARRPQPGRPSRFPRQL